MSQWHSERARNGSIDEIVLPTPTGRLWLCGKHFIGPDPEAALSRTGASTVVCLNEAEEFEPRYPGYARWLRANASTRAVWFPIPDMHVVPVDVLRPVLDDLLERLAEDKGIIVSCGAGIGRAGTVAASLLIRLGMPLDEALATLAAHRPMAGPQTSTQMEFLEDLAATVAH